MKRTWVVLIFVALVLASCNLPQPTAQTLPAPQPTAETTAPVSPPAATVSAPAGTPAPATPRASTSTAAAPTARPGASPTPANPSDVVSAYLIAYPDDTQAMLSCLSSSLKAALPSGGPALLLKAEGDINGFAIQSGSTSPNPPEAVVVVAMQAGNAQLKRTFNLIQENGRWVINSITP